MNLYESEITSNTLCRQIREAVGFQMPADIVKAILLVTDE